ncbi:MAG: hypothetical protein WCQ16_08910, partial [Verrucomicrobiae bacterium]
HSIAYFKLLLVRKRGPPHCVQMGQKEGIASQAGLSQESGDYIQGRNRGRSPSLLDLPLDIEY